MLNVSISYWHNAIGGQRYLKILVAGKTNSKKFHLIDWSIVRSPKDNGGLGIKHPSLMNMAMGSKILWHLISSQSEWWKNVLVKYLHGSKKQCLDIPLVERKGS
jgi:hypothetical protein